MKKKGRKKENRRPDLRELFAEANRLWDAGDARLAFRAFLRAATDGDTSAKNSVGYFLDHGIGTKKNTALAMTWYRRAAMQGDLSACSNVAINYKNNGNILRAKLWFCRAAARGDATARVELAKLQLAANNNSELLKAIRNLRSAEKSRYIDDDDKRDATKLLDDAVRRLNTRHRKKRPTRMHR